MKHRVKAILAGLAFMSMWVHPYPANAQVSMSDYTAQPPIVSEVATPNILFILDASSSMASFAANAINGGDWTETQQYGGLFDPLSCYTYDATNKRFDPTVTKDNGLVERRCDQTAGGGTTLWDGNFLNWATTKRFDAAKLAMHGGSCINTTTNAVGNRDADGICLASGSPAKKTFVNQQQWDTDYDSKGGHKTTDDVDTGSGVNMLDGRVPAAVQIGAGVEMRFHFRGGVSGMAGTFCTDNDDFPPIPNATSCSDLQWDDINDDDVVDPGETSIDNDGYTLQQFYIRAAADQEPQGVIQQVGTRARLGLMVFSSTDKGRLVTPIGSRQNLDWQGVAVETFNSNEAAMIDAVDEAYHISGTPLVESLYEGLRYMAQIGEVGSSAFHTLAFSPAVGLGSTGTGSLGSGEIDVLTGTETCPAGYISGACGRDPFFFGSDHTPAWLTPSARVDCCQNYIILFTDGSPNDQTFLPPSLVDYAQAVRGPDCCGIDPDDYDLAGLAYWGHIHDLRQATVPVIGETGHDIPGTQNVTVYSFNAFGGSSGRDLLKLTAKLGAFKDKNGNNQPDLTEEFDVINNATGVPGADGIPDTYFESDNVDEIKNQLSTAVNNILQQSGAGSSASVLASSSTGDGVLFQSFFFPLTSEGAREVSWTGYTQGMFLDTFGNLREDTNADGKLVYKDDHIVQMSVISGTNQVLVEQFEDTDEDGKPDNPTPVGTGGLKDIKSIWEAGERLALTTAANRKLLTWVDDDDNGVIDTKLVFDTGNSAALGPYLQAEVAPSPYTADAIINFIRGCKPSVCAEQANLRDRQLTVGGSLNVWKLGDAIHAPPVVVGAPALRYDAIYGDSSYTAYFDQYKDRRRVAYVGANDGMLHAFNAGYFHRGDDPTTNGATEHGWFTRTPTNNSAGPQLGDELWGYIPQELLPHLKWLADPNYSHVYYVDLKPKVVDARIFATDADHPNGWGTVLMGGFRLGGSCGNCTSGNGAKPMEVTADWDNNGATADTMRTFYSAYFVLDVTNPEVDPKLLWSYSSSDLGLTTTVPSMLRVSPSVNGIIDNTNAQWIMVVGSGPTGYDGLTGQNGQIHVIDLKDGPGANNTKATQIHAETDDAFLGGSVTIDRDFDYRVDVSYWGSVVDDGTLPWRGKLHRLTTKGCAGSPCSNATWGIDFGGQRGTTEILDTFEGGTLELGPVTARPAVVTDDSNKLWIFAGTGRYYSMSDKTDTSQQYFVGVKDSVHNGVCTEVNNNKVSCHDDNLVNVSGAQVCVLGVGTCGGTTDQVTGVTGATDFAGLINLVALADGWYTKLINGERSLARPVVFAGIVFFPTFTPTNDPCASTGTSELYALYYLTGSAYSSPVIGTTPSGSNENINRSTSLGDGLASEMTVHIGEGSKEKQVNLCSQNSHGEVSCIKSGTAFNFTSRFLTWNQLYD